MSAVLDRKIEKLPAREQWLERRRELGLGGSDAAVVVGYSTFREPHELWLEKLGLLEPSTEETEMMSLGHDAEPMLAEWYERVTGRKTVDLGPYTIVRSAEHDFMFSTVDRLIEAPDKPGAGVLSIKVTNALNARKWIEEPPPGYQVQAQHELSVTGAQWGSFAVLGGAGRFWFDFERHDGAIATLVQREAEFWRRVVERDEPPAGRSQRALKVLKHLYAEESGEVIQLPAEAREWIEQWEAAKAEQNEAEARARAFEALLRQKMGAATFGTLPDGTTLSLKTTKRAGYAVNPTTFRQLRRIER